MKGFDQTVRQFIAEKSVQFKLVDIYRQNPKATPQELTQLMEKGVQIDAVKNPQVATQQKRYLSEVLETLKKETTEEGFKARLTNIIKTPPQSNLIAGEWTSRF